MTIRFLIFGKAREEYLKSGYREYLKRLSRYAKVSLESLKEEEIRNPDSVSIKKALSAEADRAMNQIKDGDVLCLCDIHAKKMDTDAFSSKLEELVSKNGNLVFLFGSSYGLDDRLRMRADFAFSLSDMTFTHYLALLVTMEQVYRAMKISHHEVYDK
mgnify:CR=1 FL=1